VSKSSSSNKSFAIPKQLVWEAYRRVAANKGAAGVDGQSIEDFETGLGDNLCPVRKVPIGIEHGDSVVR